MNFLIADVDDIHLNTANIYVICLHTTYIQKLRSRILWEQAVKKFTGYCVSLFVINKKDMDIIYVKVLHKNLEEYKILRRVEK